MLGGRVSSRATWSCCSWSSAESSIVTMRSRSSMKVDRALSIVVLPEPVPPEMMTLRRAWTIPRSDLRHRSGSAAELDHPVHADRLLGELADRQQRAVDRQRRDDGVDARPVGQARVDQRRGFVDPAADGADDLLDDPQQVPLVLEARGDLFEQAEALDEDGLVAVDQDVVDRLVLEQRLERAEAEQLVEHVVRQRRALGAVEHFAAGSSSISPTISATSSPICSRGILSSSDRLMRSSSC